MIVANANPIPKARYRYEWPPPRFDVSRSRLFGPLITPPDHPRPYVRAFDVILDPATLDANQGPSLRVPLSAFL